MRIFVDCTGLHADPLLTGIQRVTREMLRHWLRHEAELCAVRFDPARGFVAIDPASLALLLEQPTRDDAALRQKLRDRAPSGDALALADDALIAVPEVFFDQARARFHTERLRRNPRAVAVLSYDFIPWLQPDRFPLPTVVSLMPYLRLVRDARHVAFISEQTRREYVTRILRRPGHAGGPVLPLGADGLGMERQSWSPHRREFVALGSIDGRKNQHRIVEAFELLWRNGIDARLTLLGRVFDGADRAWLERARQHPNFRWIDHPSQEVVAATLREARGTIYVSAVEGFGLPPVESLMVGIPVISTIDIPSLEGLPPGCHYRLPAADPGLIASAVSELLDDHHAAAMWREASSVRLATWRDFGEAMARWLMGIAGEAE